MSSKNAPSVRRPATPHVFISSTCEDLEGYRAAAKEAVISVPMLPVMCETFASGSGDNPPMEECLRKVSECDVLIVLVAHRYGWKPADQKKPKKGEPLKSITWMECQQAIDLGKEVLAFFIGETGDWPTEFKESYRATVAMENDALTDELHADIKDSIAGLKQFKSLLNGRRFRRQVTNKENLEKEIVLALHEWRSRHSEFDAPVVEPGQPVSSQTYLRKLLAANSFIDIRGLMVASGKAHQFPIEDLYIALQSRRAAGMVGEKADKKQATGAVGIEAIEGEIPLQAALVQPRLVVIGNPGAGKTTFLRRVALTLCRTELDDDPHAALAWLGVSDKTFPILLRCATLANHIAKYLDKDGAPSDPSSPAWLTHCLATISREESTGLDEAFFKRQLEDGRCTILLDGLDEAPDRVQRDRLSALSENLGRTYDKCRLVVTSRPPAYTGNTVLPQFEHVEIAPLSDAAVDTFLSRWCRELYKGATDLADEHCRELLASLHERPEIRRVARNPVMLTALAVVHWNERRMPEQRAELYNSVITWLSRSREQRPERPKPERTVTLLKELALAMQKHRKGRQTQVSKRWAAEQLAAHFADIPAAEEFLTAEELDSGIVIGLGHDLRFWHLQFQEFLAASAIAGLAEADQHALLLEPAPKLYLPEWREVLLLFAGALHAQGETKVHGFVARVLDECDRSVSSLSGTNPSERQGASRRSDGSTRQAGSLPNEARCVGLLGAMFRDLKPVDYAPREPRYDAMLQRVMAIFERAGSQAVDVRERIAAADALGQVGDPRLHPLAPDRWVTIPVGTFWMGSQKTDPKKRNYDKDAQDNAPLREVTLPEFSITRFPVTVEEYQRFVEAEGYRLKEHWEQGGFGQWTEPANWSDQLEHRNRPVVGVSWLEATAYCHWVGVRLPTEEEWERAARGMEGRKYPWGWEDADATRLNYNGNIGHPTPVGIYPLGHTPEGLADMAGNVWEWCNSWYNDEKRYRVLRGGSFVNDVVRVTHAAIRYYGTPDARDVVAGFRVCRSVRTL